MEPAIEYAPAQPWHRRPQFRRRVVLIVAILLVGAAGWILGPRVYRRIAFVYWQSKCMAFSFPPGTVADDQSIVRPGPVEISEMADALGPPRDGRFFCERTLFMHERTSSAGRRLVIINTSNWIVHSFSKSPAPSTGFVIDGWLDVKVIEPGGFFDDPKVAAETLWINFSMHADSPTGTGLTFYGGVADPGDLELIEIPCDVEGVRCSMQFRLEGENVKFVEAK